VLLADVVESNHEGAGVYYARTRMSTRHLAVSSQRRNISAR
jgi:hypothetical protein